MTLPHAGPEPTESADPLAAHAAPASAAVGARPRWTADEITAELQRLHAANVVMTYRGLVDAGHLALARAIQNFGGLDRFRRLAGLPFRRRAAPQPAIDAATVLAEICRRHEAGEPLASSKVPLRLRNAGARHFGDWEGAIQAAGLDYADVRLSRSYTNEELLERLRELARTCPEMTLAELYRDPIGTTLSSRFGSPMRAARRAGIAGWPHRSHGPREH